MSAFASTAACKALSVFGDDLLALMDIIVRALAIIICG
jgi:hypothetical protein